MKTVLMFLVMAAAPPEFGGKWTLTGEVAGNPIKAACTFEQAEAKVSGVCKLEGRGDAKVAGEVTDKKLVFRHDVDHEGAQYTLIYTAELTPENGLKGTIEVAGAGVGGDFSAKRE